MSIILELQIKGGFLKASLLRGAYYLILFGIN